MKLGRDNNAWGNFQRSTLNVQRSKTTHDDALEVERWKLDVRSFFISPRSRRSPLAAHLRRAFTLIEIMMAMAIFGMVVTAIYATWTLIIKSHKIGLEAAAAVQRERVTISTFKDALSCACSYQADLKNFSFLVENGSTPSLSFVARLPDSFPRSSRFKTGLDGRGYDIRRVTFTLENGPDGGQQLLLRQSPVLKELDEDEQNFPFVLSKNVSKMEFLMWDARKGKLVDEWTTTNEIPKKIVLTLTYSRQNPDKPHMTAQTEVVSYNFKVYSTMVPAGFQRAGQPQGTPPPP